MKGSKFAAALFCVVLYFSPLAGAAEYAIELPLRGPDARPLVNTEIEIREREGDPANNRKPHVEKCKTDSAGVAHFSWPKSIDSVIVIAKGVGYGQTGVFEIIGKSGKASAPPLVPFGSIAGTIPKDMLVPKTTITLYAGHEWTVVAEVGAGGEFVLKDLPAGRWFLEPVSGGRSLDAFASVSLRAGEDLKNVRFYRRDPPGKIPELVGVLNLGRRETKTTWVSGVVRDRSGNPVSGASVYAAAAYPGSIRMIEEMHDATTDASGRFSIEGSVVARGGGTLLVWKEGFTPLVDWIPVQYPESQNNAALPAPSTRPAKAAGSRPAARPAPAVELVLNDRGGRLDVAILQDGKPVPNASVMLHSSHLGEIYGRYSVASWRGSEHEEITDLLEPICVTDARGVAHFTQLIPDCYDIYATTSDAAALRDLPRHGLLAQTDVIHGMAKGVPVSGEALTSYSMSIANYHRIVQVRLLGIDGKPIPNTQPGSGHDGTQYEVFGPDAIQLSNSDLDIGERGRITFPVDSAGIWTFQASYRDSASQQPLSVLPYNRATALVAISPLIKTIPAIEVAARHFQAGSLVVEVKDLEGKPVHAAVLIDHGFGGASTLAGVTEELGMIRFENIVPFQHSIEIQPLGGRDNLRINALSTDASLSGRTGCLLQEVKTRINNETHVVARAIGMGFISGSFTPPAGKRRSNYYLFATSKQVQENIPTEYDADRGRFVIGPIPPGAAELYLYRSQPNALVESRSLEIRAGEVVHANFSPAADPPEVIPQIDFLGSSPAIDRLLKRASKSPDFRVLLADKKTPAYGASLTCYAAGIDDPVAGGNSDINGHMHLSGRSFFLLDSNKVNAPGNPKGPVLVARLPGTFGATVVPIPEALPKEGMTIVLPPAIELGGHVTLGGAEPRPNSGRITVLAAREDMGKLNEVLSVSMTAQANGFFGLRGLTPGRYRVQASLDGIWFSNSFQLEVTAEKRLEPMTLDIAAPGGALVVHVVDEKGAARVGIPVKVSRPAGPLTESLWPFVIETDGAGVARIPALEVGVHEVTAGELPREQEVDIPLLKGGDAPKEISITLPASRREK